MSKGLAVSKEFAQRLAANSMIANIFISIRDVQQSCVSQDSILRVKSTLECFR